MFFYIACSNIQHTAKISLHVRPYTLRIKPFQKGEEVGDIGPSTPLHSGTFELKWKNSAPSLDCGSNRSHNNKRFPIKLKTGEDKVAHINTACLPCFRFYPPDLVIYKLAPHSYNFVETPVGGVLCSAYLSQHAPVRTILSKSNGAFIVGARFHGLGDGAPSKRQVMVLKHLCRSLSS